MFLNCRSMSLVEARFFMLKAFFKQKLLSSEEGSTPAPYKVGRVTQFHQSLLQV